VPLFHGETTDATNHDAGHDELMTAVDAPLTEAPLDTAATPAAAGAAPAPTLPMSPAKASGSSSGGSYPASWVPTQKASPANEPSQSIRWGGGSPSSSVAAGDGADGAQDSAERRAEWMHEAAAAAMRVLFGNTGAGAADAAAGALGDPRGETPASQAKHDAVPPPSASQPLLPTSAVTAFSHDAGAARSAAPSTSRGTSDAVESVPPGQLSAGLASVGLGTGADTQPPSVDVLGAKPSRPSAAILAVPVLQTRREFRLVYERVFPHRGGSCAYTRSPSWR